MTKYTNTRNHGEADVANDLNFCDVVMQGISKTGGLFVPLNFPTLSLDEIVDLANAPYHQRAAHIYKRFEIDLCDAHVDGLMSQAYGENFDDERIAPVEEVVAGINVLELWHGPTHAFKDMALQCMPLFFSAAIEKSREQASVEEHARIDEDGATESNTTSTSGEDYLILVATSGDTGKAALEGFADREHVSMIVFYPTGGVSDIQRKQMVTQRGDNVAVYSVNGNFDDCQSAVKEAFADPDFAAWLSREHNVKLSSANSINWGRLMPQIVYYVSAYADMVASGAVLAGETIDVSVPTGNFGDILAGYYAKMMGVPIDRLICASNENRVLTDFINTGTYDISDREFHLTVAPSMDILISSNLERLLFELTDRNGAQIDAWMQQLREEGRFKVDERTFARLREHFSADCVTSDEALATIKRVYDETGYLLDPHSAIAWEVGERIRSDRPMLVVSTAHWAKFGRDVLRALTGVAAGAPLPAEYDDLTGAQMNEHVCEIASSASAIPVNLRSIDSAVVRFDTTVHGGCDQIASVVKQWLG